MEVSDYGVKKNIYILNSECNIEVVEEEKITLKKSKKKKNICE